MTIKVCNNHFHKENPDKDIYIARPSILGNPWSHMDSSYPDAKKTETRKEAVDNYIQYFLQKYKNDKEFKEIIDDLVELHKKGQDINLICFCAPQQCHGDVIKQFIEHKVKRDKFVGNKVSKEYVAKELGFANVNELEEYYKGNQ